jgi:hypothetical protein
MIICPDKTCAYSELECRSPPKCNDGLVMCPDQSCRPTFDDCPKAKTCASGYALCDDMSCRLACSDHVLYKDMNQKLVRMLQKKSS